MKTRIDTRFEELKSEGRPGLVTFVMAGDPDHETSLEIVRALPAAGADLIEIGMPFSDPMADGPAIQLAGQRALHGATTDADASANGHAAPDAVANLHPGPTAHTDATAGAADPHPSPSAGPERGRRLRPGWPQHRLH